LPLFSRLRAEYDKQPLEDLLKARFTKLMEFGKFKEVATR
jgi:hypothetical protein